MFTADRVCSMLTDFGVEKDAWIAPALDVDASAPTDDRGGSFLLFKYNMPLPDCDHSLHHAPCQQTGWVRVCSSS